MKNNLKFIGMILSGILVVLFLLLSVLSLNDVQAQYDGYPPPGYPAPIDIGYPAPQPTEFIGYPAPQPTEFIGYPAPITIVSDPPSPFNKSTLYYDSDYKNEEEFTIKSPMQKLKEIVKVVVRSIKINKNIHVPETNRIIKHYGKFILEMK